MLLALSPFLLVCPLFGGETSPSQEQRQLKSATPVYNFSLQLIARTVDDADPADEQFGWGLEFDGYNPRDAVGWEIGVSRTSDDTSDAGGNFEVTIQELYTGARKTWGAAGELHPYVGLGVSWVDAEADSSTSGSDDDSSFGLYGHGGAYWTLGQHFNVGADVRALVGTDIGFGDADYFQGAVVLGYSL